MFLNDFTHVRGGYFCDNMYEGINKTAIFVIEGEGVKNTILV